MSPTNIVLNETISFLLTQDPGVPVSPALAPAEGAVHVESRVTACALCGGNLATLLLDSVTFQTTMATLFSNITQQQMYLAHLSTCAKS